MSGVNDSLKRHDMLRFINARNRKSAGDSIFRRNDKTLCDHQTDIVLSQCLIFLYNIFAHKTVFISKANAFCGSHYNAVFKCFAFYL